MSRINCAHLDLADGLYKTLRNSITAPVKVQEMTGGTYELLGHSITTSELAILTQYAQENVAYAPQFITTSLWSYCFGYYDTYEETNKDGEVVVKKKNQSLVCQDLVYTFDYRGVLTQAGLEIIIAYAYDNADEDTDQEDQEDQDYENKVASRHHRFIMVRNSIIFACVSQLIVLGVSLVVYGNRNGEQDLSKTPRILLHVIGLFSLASFASIMIGLGLVTRLLVITKQEVKSKLSDFGIVYYFGKTWFGLIWSSTLFALLSMCTWALPLWCANPEFPLEDYDDYEDQEFIFHPKQRKTTTSFLPPTASQSLKAKFPKFRKHKSYIRIPGPVANEQHQQQTRFQPRPSIENEDELRKLGEKLSKSASVRRTNTKSSHKQLNNPPIQNPFLDENNTTKHKFYQEEIYDGYASNNSSIFEGRRRANTGESIPLHNMDKKGGTPIEERTTRSNSDDDDNRSYLEDDEMEVLDNLMFKLV